MRRVLLGAIALIATSGVASGSERAAALLNSFQVMCTIEDLDFAASDAKAAAMRLPVRQDLNSGIDANGYYMKSKSWLLLLTNGPHEFSVTEGKGPKGNVKICGIAEPNVMGDDELSEISRTMKLSDPSTTVSADGVLRTTTWKFGYKDYKVMLIDRTPKGAPGFYLNLMQAPWGR